MDDSVELNLEEIVQDDAAPAPETEELREEAPAQKEPGWYKARFAHDLERERKKWEAEQEEKLAPIYEYMMERQAQELVDSGEIKNPDRAKEYLQMKRGRPASDPAEDPTIKARADLLARQADKIKANRGLDVMSVFNNDPDIQRNVLSGEWDFYDVAEAMKKSPPAPMRSPNGAGISITSIQNMSDEQFKRLQANLAGGRKYDMRK